MSQKKTRMLTIIFIAAAACLIYAINGGIRSNYGILLSGVTKFSGVEYASVSFVFAVAQLMFGITQPVFGVLALKKSNAFVLCLGTVMAVIGLMIIPLCTSMWSLMIFLGILMPSGLGALSFGVVMGAITPVLGQKTAATVSGLVSASSGLGSVVLSPLLNLMLTKSGLWGCMIALGVPTAFLIPISIWLSKAGQGTAVTAENHDLSVKRMIAEAFQSRSYLLLLFAFFTCGFQMAIIETHLYSHMTSQGLSDSIAAYLFSIYGVTTMVGSVITGVLSSKFKMKWVAGVTFSLRLFIIGAFLALPKTLLNFGVFAALLGLTGSATVPPISGLTGKLFGPARLATLFGLLMVSHQIGSFFSAWLGGVCITATGSYTLIWLVSGCLAILAGVACFLVKEPEAAKIAGVSVTNGCGT